MEDECEEMEQRLHDARMARKGAEAAELARLKSVNAALLAACETEQKVFWVEWTDGVRCAQWTESIDKADRFVERLKEASFTPTLVAAPPLGKGGTLWDVCPACKQPWDSSIIPPPRVSIGIRCACCCQNDTEKPLTLFEAAQQLVTACKKLPASDGRLIGLLPLIDRVEAAMARK